MSPNVKVDQYKNLIHNIFVWTNQRIEGIKNIGNATVAPHENLEFVYSFILNLVHSSCNDSSTTLLSNDKLKVIIFYMDLDSIPGPNGFSGVFYKICWNISAVDLSVVVHHLFKTGWIPP